MSSASEAAIKLLLQYQFVRYEELLFGNDKIAIIDEVDMASVQVIIRYSFTETEEGGRKTTALINASLPGESVESAVNYLIKRYPERYNIEILEMSLYK